MATLFMETTRVDESRTVAEIQRLLATRGANAVMIEYERGKIASVSFRLRAAGQDIPFRLPCRWRELEKLLKQSNRSPKRDDTYESWARRVGWRQILRWVEAQLALIETGMVQPEEVFLPYAIVAGANGQAKTMYELCQERKFLALPAPEDPNG